MYVYKVHKAKLELLQGILLRAEDFRRLREYLLSIVDPAFPHRLFGQDGAALDSTKESLRSSQTKLRFLKIANKRKENLASRLASQGLLLAQSNRGRHKQIQDFMLINDSSTLACEVPVYLRAEHIKYFHEKGFYLPITESETPITGHIDLVQVRQRYVHILDYKPDARKIQPISQLTIYALALASQTKLPLKLFKCAWFDEQDYFEFYPLQAVYRKRRTQ
ncbi:MAG: PD-(D/E)XK nuclease family protein [Chloroflexi bacterium]|nr:PD-(D/E)XK nuclease family protein [Chloroflexota bacterium]